MQQTKHSKQGAKVQDIASKKRMEIFGCVFVMASGTLALLGVIFASTCYSRTRDAAALEPQPPAISAAQSELLHAVSKECEELNEFVSTQSWNDSIPRMIVDDQRRVLFCAIPKVASSNWKRVFIKALNITKNGSPVITDVHAPGLLPDLRHFSKQEQEYRLENYFKFMFVRNPMERLLSAYRNKLENKDVAFYSTQVADPETKQGEEHLVMKVVTRNSPHLQRWARKITFADFANTLTDPLYKIKHYNSHWKQYYKLCHPCFVKYDFIGKMETFDTDLQYVQHKTGLDYGPWFEKTMRTTTPDVTMQYYESLTTRSKRVLAKMYRIDMSMFQY